MLNFKRNSSWKYRKYMYL